MKRILRVEVVLGEGDKEERVDVRALHVERGGAVLLAMPPGFDHVDVMRMIGVCAEKSGVEFLGVHPSVEGKLAAIATSALVVSALLGYGGHDDPVDEHHNRCAKLREAGFVRYEVDFYHHAPDAPGELFVLPGPWAAKGPVKGQSIDAIRQWVMREVQPGVIEVVAQRWGLGPG